MYALIPLITIITANVLIHGTLAAFNLGEDIYDAVRDRLRQPGR